MRYSFISSAVESNIQEQTRHIQRGVHSKYATCHVYDETIAVVDHRSRRNTNFVELTGNNVCIGFSFFFNEKSPEEAPFSYDVLFDMPM